MKFFGFECIVVVIVAFVVVVAAAVARGSCYVCHKRAPAWAWHEIDFDFGYVVIQLAARGQVVIIFVAWKLCNN